MHRSSRPLMIALMSIVIPLALSTPLQATQRMVLAEEFTNYT